MLETLYNGVPTMRSKGSDGRFRCTIVVERAAGHYLALTSMFTLVLLFIPGCQKKQALKAAGTGGSQTTENTLEKAINVPKTGRNYEFGHLASVVLFSGTEKPRPGLRVEIIEPVTWSSQTRALFSYRVTNLLDDDVFLAVQPIHVVGCNYDGPEGLAGGGSGSGISFPGNLSDLRHLTADGIDSCFTEVRAATDVPFFASDRGKATVSILVWGFYRSNGTKFLEFIDLSLPLDGRPNMTSFRDKAPDK